MGAKIELKKVSFTYGNGVKQVKNINLTIQSGEAVLFTGQSGSGKTTLTRLINGLIPHFFEGMLTGDVVIDDKNVIDMKMWERGEKIGNVFQDPRSQFFASEVAGEIAFGCENFGLSHEMIRERVDESVEKIGILPLLSRKLASLSYGERQKVAIASANAIRPNAYVMDEPSANLDMASTEQFGQLLKILKSEGATLVIAEHRLYYLMDIVDRIIYMQEGEITGEYTPEELKKLPKKRIEEMGLRSPELSSVALPSLYTEQKGKEVITLQAVSTALDNTNILEQVSLSVYEGEVVAVIGSNGAGKSTIGRLLAGLIKEKRGRIFMNNVPTKSKNRRGAIWYIMQDLDSQLFGESILDELFIGDVTQNDGEKERALQLLKKLGLCELKEQHPQCLSGGQKQRLVLGAALMRNTQVLILDEPTSGLDGMNMLRVASLIRSLAKEGRSILIITHDYELIMHACDRVIHIENGKLQSDTQLSMHRNVLSVMTKKTSQPSE